MNKVKIIIQPLAEIKNEWKKALTGKVKSLPKKGVLIFSSVETLGKILTPTRMELLMTIIREKPRSIYFLAKILERDFKNVYTDIKLLSEVGFLDLKSGGKKFAVRPVAKYSGFEIDLAA